jgi:SAM-dependent methyltransferase
MGVETFFAVGGIPVHSCLLMQSRQQALEFQTGDLELAACPDCGFVFNTRFDASVHNYSEQYEETQGFSPTFNAFARALVDQLIERHALRNKTVLEIGCGKGEFLVGLCEAGPNRGIGIDPSYIPARTDSPAAERIEFIRDFYSEAYTHLKADFVCCRHTLEHIAPTRQFMHMVRSAIGENAGAVVFFELPEAMRVLREGAFWDIYYEHCTYFTPGSLARVFRDCGFEVTDVELVYDEQYIVLTALPADGPTIGSSPAEESPADVARAVAEFRRMAAERIDHWKTYVATAAARDERAVIWGSGSKGVAFLTTLGLTREIEYVVDINPHKHGKFMPVTAQEIIPPDRLSEYQPQHVIVMNPIYCDEIQRDLDRLGIGADLVAV